MTNRTEGAIAVAAAFFVLLAAMLDPRVSAGLAILILVGLGFYRLAFSR